GDEKASQGWCPTVLDTNGDGKISKPWNEPVGGGRDMEEGAGGGKLGTIDAKLDTRVLVGGYGIVAAPDGALWAASTDYPGHMTRTTVGNNPPATCMTELYTVPDGEIHFGPRGIDIDRNGIVWLALSGSGELASFDRKKCTVFNGMKTVDGLQCPQGWAFYKLDGPNLKGTDIRA